MDSWREEGGLGHEPPIALTEMLGFVKDYLGRFGPCGSLRGDVTITRSYGCVLDITVVIFKYL